jgi:iron complex outermembrane receptor protein
MLRISNRAISPSDRSKKMTRYPIALISVFSLNPYCLAFAQGQNAVQLPAVTVTADAPAEQTKHELEAEQALTPGGVTVVDSEAFYQRNVYNMADMLRYVPGVWAASATGSDGAFISIRGSNLDAVDYDGSGVKLLQDGLPVTAADGNNHNRFIDPLTARYAIVARGANALTYGASTLGGAIDFTTVTALDGAPFEAFVGGGSHGLIQGRLSAGKVMGDFDGLATVEAKHMDGYREHSEQNRTGAYANAGWQLNETLRNRFYFTYVQNDEELPGGLTRDQWRDDPDQAAADAVIGDYQWNVQTWRAANKTTWDIDANSSLSVGFSYEEQDLFHPIVWTPFGFSLLINTEQRNFGTALRYNLRVDKHDLLAGLNYGRTWVDGGNYNNDRGQRAGLRQDVDNDADSLELFLMDRWRFAPQWSLVYGAQGILADREVRNIAAAPGFSTLRLDDDYSSINPRAGLIYHLTPRIELFTNVSRVYEAPTLYQLDDGLTSTDPNDGLDAMHGTVFELGTRGTLAAGKNQWHWDVAAYYTKLHDEILSVDGPLPGQGDPISGNVDETIHAGIEALVGASFPLDASGSHRIEPLISATWNDFYFDDDPLFDRNELPAAPRYVIRGEVLYRNAGGFFFGPTFDLVGKRYADFANSYKIDSYTLWGLRGGLVRKDWEMYAELRNLGDEEYIARHSVQALAASDADILSPGEPRSVYVGVRLRY